MFEEGWILLNSTFHEISESLSDAGIHPASRNAEYMETWLRIDFDKIKKLSVNLNMPRGVLVIIKILGGEVLKSD